MYENVTLARVASLYIGFAAGIALHRARSGLAVCIALLIAEMGLLSDAWNAGIVLAVTTMTIAAETSPRWRPSPRWSLLESTRRAIVVVVTAVICARLLRRGAWVCRTFRGPHDVASMVIPAIIGYAASICARSKAPRIVIVISGAAMLSVMSPWHGADRGHISFILIVLIGLMVVSYPNGLVFTLAQFGWLLASHIWRMERLGSGTRIDHVVLFVIAIAQVCVTVGTGEPEKTGETGKTGPSGSGRRRTRRLRRR